MRPACLPPHNSEKCAGNTGIKTGESLEKVYNKVAFRKGIKEISEIKKMPIVITAVDIKDGKEYIFTNCVPKVENKEKYITDIPIGKAVRASSSFPAIFCPCEFKEHSFYDGGVLDNVPVKEVKKQGANKVIAINFKADDVDNSSNIMDLGMRTLDIMGNKISEKSLEISDFILTIKTDKTGLLQYQLRRPGLPLPDGRSQRPRQTHYQGAYLATRERPRLRSLRYRNVLIEKPYQFIIY